MQIVGRDVWTDPVAVKSRIGVLPEGLRLFERLSGRELLTFTGRLRGLPGAEVDLRATQLLDVLDLSGAQHKLVVDYSTGMRKKIGLAAALLHNPEVLFLDEPFEGVDPVSAQVIRGVLERYTGTGGTVVFSSHVMELVESLCDWVAVMAAGRIVAHGPLAEVRGDADTLQDAFLSLVGARPRQRRRPGLAGRGPAMTTAGPLTADPSLPSGPAPGPRALGHRHLRPAQARGACATGCGSPAGRAVSWCVGVAFAMLYALGQRRGDDRPA